MQPNATVKTISRAIATLAIPTATSTHGAAVAVAGPLARSGGSGKLVCTLMIAGTLILRWRHSPGGSGGIGDQI